MKTRINFFSQTWINFLAVAHTIQCKAFEVQVSNTRGATKDDFSGQVFRIFGIIIFCFVVAICGLVHAVEAIFGLP